MSTHPSLEALFDAASGDHPPADITAHLSGCPDCRVAAARLAEGARIMDEARHAPTDIRWEAIDAAIAAEAHSVAADIRARALRPVLSWRRIATAGVTMAAAAAAMLAVREGRLPLGGASDPAAVGTVVPPDGVACNGSSTVPSLAAWEGAVLLSAGGATWQDAAGSSALGSVSALHEGGRITAGAHGRGVVTVQPGWTLDVRPGATVTLPRLRAGEVTVALADGTAALEPGPGASPDARVDINAGHWTVASAGAFTAGVTVGMVHVVVLGSSVTVQRDDAAAVRFSGPIVLDLPDVGSVAEVVHTPARDADALDLSTVSVGGRLWSLPPVDPTAVLTAVGHGGLPSGLEAIRLGGPMSFRARLAHATLSLDIGTGRPVEWVRTGPAVASAQPGAVHTVAPGRVPGSSAVTGLQPAPEPDETSRQVELIAARAGGFFRHCIEVCQERGQCQEPRHGYVLMNIDTDGRVSSVVIDPSVSDPRTRQCIENQAQFVNHIPGSHTQVAIPLR